jgi:hypothetical protein
VNTADQRAMELLGLTPTEEEVEPAKVGSADQRAMELLDLGGEV